MTGTDDKMLQELKDLKCKRSSLKGRLTTFEKYLHDLQQQVTSSKVQYEVKTRLKKIEKLFEEYDLIQTSIEVTQENPENESERELTEGRFYRSIAEAQDLINTIHINDSDTKSSGSGASITNTHVKLPQIKIPNFDGDISKWLEFHDTYSSLIHNNESIASINKYQYLKSALTGSASSVIASLEISSRNYEIAWKLLCDRYNDKRKLVCSHLKSLFDVTVTSGEKSLRSLADHIAKHLRALNTLDENTDNWDTLIIFLFTAKLDNITSIKWEEQKNILNEKPNLEHFYIFLRQRADILEATSLSSSDQDCVRRSSPQFQQLPYTKRLSKQQKSFVATTCENSGTKNINCLVCNDEHLIYYCEKFLSMSPADRFNMIVKHRYCINCLRSGHLASQCKSRPCKICNKKHNSLLHFENTNAGSKQLVSTPISLSTCVANQILLSTAIIKVTSTTNSQILEARCLLDCGSQSSFISQRLKDNLGIQSESVSSVCVTGINNISFEALQRCNIKLQSRTSAFSTLVNAFVIKEITSTLPSHEVDISNIKLPKNITLADCEYYKPAKVDLLLGADIFWDILCSEQIKLGRDLPILQNSMFGWLISGPAMCCKDTGSKSKIVCNFSREIRQQLDKFWELEEVPLKPVRSQEEEACEAHFVQHTRRLEDGRFCVTLPLKVEPSHLGDSFYKARKRFESLEKRFRKQPDVKTQYVNFLEEYEYLSHLSQVERSDGAVFFPHHPVLKESSESTKCRVVFDASCKTSSGLSLNDIMMVGPTVQDDIFSILIRLRQHTFIFTGDIEKMYRQILVEPHQRHLQTILWRKNEVEPLKYLQLNTVTYGTSSAPFLSTRCIVQLATECTDPVIREVMLHDWYIDDLITGHCIENKLYDIYKEITNKLQSAGFKLRKLKSNSRELLKLISNESDTDSKQENLKISSVTSTLGIEWDPTSDCILISVKKSKNYESFSYYTKRIVLSVSSSIFDPLGLLSVCIITCKMILQLLWLQKIGWDEQIPDDISQMWLKFVSNFKYIERLSIPRQAICSFPIKIDLHTFSDASLKAYAACVYVRSSDALGQVTVRLLAAKSKVAPLKTATIPRLELCGAVLAARLCKKVAESLRCKVDAAYFWCDSKVVLGWLNTPPHKLNTFVSHRVAEISELYNINTWRYVPSSLNPADLASRGVYPEDVKNLTLWWDGPSFLKDTQQSWPDHQRDGTHTDLPEIRVNFVSLNTVVSSIEFKRYSNFKKLRRIVAYVYRFINFRNNKQTGYLTVDELEQSELRLAKLSQQESFQNFNDNFKKIPALYSLTPFIDKMGIIRVGGRLHNSDYRYDKIHPIILDSKHHYTMLIMKYYHVKLMHAGPQLLLSVVREQYWPIGGRVLAKQVCKDCITCRRQKGAIAKQIMGNLPTQRLSPGFPFEISGIDYAGPFMILNRRGRGARLIKCYLCVFICFKIKAVHLELVSDLSTEAFILALRRFISRRGKPREIFCDNGTNFVGASREIATLVNNFSDSVSDFANEGIVFKFSPVASPHFGGLYEAAVKSAKFHLKRVVGNAHFTFEELTTLFCQIEAILNSRPLVPMSSDPNDLCPLTPGHFLVGRPLLSLPAPDLQDANPNRIHRYARIEKARQHFWSRWSREYICILQQRTKWQDRQPDIKPNQLVLIRDDATPPLKWPLGRITAVYPGSDGACRVADIKTSKGILRRAINKICPLID